MLCVTKFANFVTHYLTYLFYLLNYWVTLCEQGAKDDGYS